MPRSIGQSKFVIITNEIQFDHLIQKKNNKEIWFVEFYKDYVDICLSTKAIWNEFSMLYTTKYLKFAEINIDKVPKLCERF